MRSDVYANINSKTACTIYLKVQTSPTKSQADKILSRKKVRDLLAVDNKCSNSAMENIDRVSKIRIFIYFMYVQVQVVLII